MGIDYEKMKERMMLDDYPEIKKLSTDIRRRVIVKLLENNENPDNVTRKKVQDAILTESAVCGVVKSLRRGNLLEAFESVKFTDENTDFRSAADDFEYILKTEVESCLRSGRKDSARKLVECFGKGIDFTDTAKKVHLSFIRSIPFL